MIVQITPIALNNIGYRTYIIFAVLNAAWVPVIYFFFPETKGLELEDVDRLFARDEETRERLGGGVMGDGGGSEKEVVAREGDLSGEREGEV